MDGAEYHSVLEVVDIEHHAFLLWEDASSSNDEKKLMEDEGEIFDESRKKEEIGTL